MPDHPASDPAKPGSKLASMQALGRRGNIRPSEEETPSPPRTARRSRGGWRGRRSPPRLSSSATKRVTKPKVKTVKKAKAVLKRAEKRRQSPSEAGSTDQIGQPWKALGVSKAKYYRNLKGRGQMSGLRGQQGDRISSTAAERPRAGTRRSRCSPTCLSSVSAMSRGSRRAIDELEAERRLPGREAPLSTGAAQENV